MEWLEVLIVSAMPFSELRGGIPLAIYLGLPPIEAFLLAILGNLLPIPFLLMFLDIIDKIVVRWKPLAEIYLKIVERIERMKEIVERYGYLGLLMFVAIPLPMTGAWSGSLLAFLLRLNKTKALVFIAVGVLIAGVLVLSASLGVLSNFFDGD